MEEGETSPSKLAIVLSICYMGSGWMLINLNGEVEYL